jgi:hypothetical protein
MCRSRFDQSQVLHKWFEVSSRKKQWEFLIYAK